MADRKTLETFLALSAVLTGFRPDRLVGTGQTALHHDTMRTRVGDANMKTLLETWTTHVAGAEDVDRAVRHHILGDPRLGPMARRLIKLWYVGCWKEMPQHWRETYGGGLPDGDIVPSPTSYTEGLLWPAVGANPPGAKPFGYAMWARPPRVTLDQVD